jgi:hypothetical protein
MKLALIILGANGCPACSHFKPEKERIVKDFPKDFPDITVYDYTISTMSPSGFKEVPKSLSKMVNFFPFLLLTTDDHWQKNKDLVKVYGDALYGVAVDSGDTISYFPGSSVSECPSMAYKRTYEGVRDWINNSAEKAVQRMIRNGVIEGTMKEPLAMSAPGASARFSKIITLMDIIDEDYVSMCKYTPIPNGQVLRKRIASDGSLLL